MELEAKYKEEIRKLNFEIGNVTGQRDSLKDALEISRKKQAENYDNWQDEIDKRHHAEKLLYDCNGQLGLCQTGALKDSTLLQKIKLLFG